eukprot:gene12508-14325_t
MSAPGASLTGIEPARQLQLSIVQAHYKLGAMLTVHIGGWMPNQALDFRFTVDHEWVRPEGQTITVGISDYVSDHIGDIVFIETPDVGHKFTKGDGSSVIKSVKAASDVYSPVSCVVTEVNPQLSDSPETVNADPFGAGWLYRARIVDESELKELKNYVQYRSEVSNEIEHVIYLDENERIRYIPAVRGLDGNIIIGGSNQLQSLLIHTFLSARELRQKNIIEEFEDIINSAKVREADVQAFFQRNPEFLTGIEFEEAIPHTILRNIDGDALIPDFILKPIAGVSHQAKIVEIKLPSEPIVRAAPRRERLYAGVYEGVAQLQTYARYFEQAENRAFVQNALGFSMYRPQLSLVIGRI